MGGTTITRVNADKDRLIEEIKSHIIAAATVGLYPDSALILLKPDTQEWEMYEVEVDVEYLPGGESHPELRLAPITEGPAFHVAVAARFGPRPKPGEWVGMVHCHS